MPADMHVERGRSCAQQMIVNRRDIEAAVEQPRHDWIDLGLQQDKVAHDRHAGVHRLERDPAAERQCRPDREWILQHLKKRAGVDARLLDLRDFPMPFFDLPATPGRPPYKNEVVQKWTAAIAVRRLRLRHPRV
jgi:hypothetical protein